MPTTSVIVPIYNVEPYLRRCVDSILAQTYTDFELILVDDGSPDNCGTICDEYAAVDNRVRVIHQANGGVSRARNAGLDTAVGKYIYFCDGDDYIEKELLSDAVRAMDGYDMVVFNTVFIKDDTEVNEYSILQKSDYHVNSNRWNEPKYRSWFLAWDFFDWNNFGFSVWCRLFRKDIIDRYNLRFPEDVVITEDVCFIFCYLLHTRSLLTIPGAYYYRVERSDSTVHVQFKHYLFETNSRVCKTMFRYLRQCSGQAMHKEYMSIVYCRLMSKEISRVKRNDSTLTIPMIRSILLEELEDTSFFFEQAKAFVGAWPMLIRKNGIHYIPILLEWSYYLDGNEIRLRIRTFILFLLRAAYRLAGSTHSLDASYGCHKED